MVPLPSTGTIWSSSRWKTVPLHPITEPPRHKSRWRSQTPQMGLGQHFRAWIQTHVSLVPILQQPFADGVSGCCWGSPVAPEPRGWGHAWYWLAPRPATTWHGTAHPLWEIQWNLPPAQLSSSSLCPGAISTKNTPQKYSRPCTELL